MNTSSDSHAFYFQRRVLGKYCRTVKIEMEVRKMGILTFGLVVILVFTALAIERVVKDIRDQNKEIIRLLKDANNNQDATND